MKIHLVTLCRELELKKLLRTDDQSPRTRLSTNEKTVTLAERKAAVGSAIASLSNMLTQISNVQELSRDADRLVTAMKRQTIEALESGSPGPQTDLLLWLNRLPLRTVVTADNLHELVRECDLVYDVLQCYFPGHVALMSPSFQERRSVEFKWRKLNSEVLPQTAMLEF